MLTRKTGSGNRIFAKVSGSLLRNCNSIDLQQKMSISNRTLFSNACINVSVPLANWCYYLVWHIDYGLLPGEVSLKHYTKVISN